MKYLFAFMSVFALTTQAFGANNINAKNWYNHPEIVKVRNIVTSVQTEISSYSRKEKKFGYCKPGEDITRRMFTDQSGVVRKFFYDAGSGDSSYNLEFFYDKKGRIRFMFVRAGAANGTLMEHRLYFNAKGQRIWEFRKQLKGPGWTFPSRVWPNEMIVYDPVKKYRSGNYCE